jgi:sugar phosphate isomerase/epimerase
MKYAICNETFGDWDFARACATAAEHGYQGIEIAPFTLAAAADDVSAQRRRELRRQADDAGLEIIGLHWLLAKTEGLHVTAADAAVRRRTADYLGALARLCRDLGGRVMVFGSPQQRRIPAGCTREQAADFALETFSAVAAALDECGVTLALEPLAPAETDFLNSCAEAVTLLDRLGHPRFGLHLDVKAMCSESETMPNLIRQFAGRTVHVHANDENRRGPGFGNVDFRPILQALKDTNYAGWISVEVFDYSPDPVTIARESIRYLKACEQ